jgi:hypothetical protein
VQFLATRTAAAPTGRRREEDDAMNHHPTATLAASLVGLALCATAEQAWANCAAGDDFGRYVDGNRVTVCPYPTATENAERICPDKEGGMLRQNVETGETVRLRDYCTGSERYQGADDSCYTDECVPPGAYRYGFATPWSNPSCSTCPPSQYFVAVDVTAPLDGGCVRSDGNDAPESYDGAVPWGERDSDNGDMCNESAWGCSLGAHPRELVFGINMIVAGLGAAAMLLRRRRARG